MISATDVLLSTNHSWHDMLTTCLKTILIACSGRDPPILSDVSKGNEGIAFKTISIYHILAVNFVFMSVVMTAKYSFVSLWMIMFVYLL